MAKINLHDIAKQKGMKLIDVAHKSGVKGFRIYEIGRSKNNLRLSTIESLCNALDCSISDLITLDKNLDKN